MAAEIVEQPPETHSTGDYIQAITQIVTSYWWLFLLIALLIAAVVIIFMIKSAKDENDRRRDSAVYATAMNIHESASQNIKQSWVSTKWSWWNLVWLGIPFIMKEYSVKLVDIDRNLIGWYRGHTKTQNGDVVFRYYKTKSWLGLVEDKQLLYCPAKITKPRMETRKINGVDVEVQVRDGSTGKPIVDYVPLPDDMISFADIIKGNEIVIKCNTVLKQGNYYRFPNYVIVDRDGKQHHIDLSFYLAEFVARTNFIVTLENGFADMSRSMGEAANLNPVAKVIQKLPEKEKNLNENQDGTN